MTSYGETANGQHIELAMKDEFEILLPETRTAGYRWSVHKDGGPTCELIAEKSHPNTAGVGGSGTHQWRFRGVSAGAGEIELRYTRPWAGKPEPAKIFRLGIRVHT